jgi:hypothetical protein
MSRGKSNSLRVALKLSLREVHETILFDAARASVVHMVRQCALLSWRFDRRNIYFILSTPHDNGLAYHVPGFD